MTTEEEAIIGDRMAIIQIVSALRKYRAATKRALDLRYGDGTIDGANASTLEIEIKEIEEELSGEP